MAHINAFVLYCIKGPFILHSYCVVVPIYWLLSAVSPSSFTAFHVKMNLTFMRHCSAVTSQFLFSSGCSAATQRNCGVVWMDLYCMLHAKRWNFGMKFMSCSVDSYTEVLIHWTLKVHINLHRLLWIACRIAWGNLFYFRASCIWDISVRSRNLIWAVSMIKKPIIIKSESLFNDNVP